LPFAAPEQNPREVYHRIRSEPFPREIGEGQSMPKIFSAMTARERDANAKRLQQEISFNDTRPLASNAALRRKLDKTEQQAGATMTNN
jgi:hypothetical protein